MKGCNCLFYNHPQKFEPMWCLIFEFAGGTLFFERIGYGLFPPEYSFYVSAVLQIITSFLLFLVVLHEKLSFLVKCILYKKFKL